MPTIAEICDAVEATLATATVGGAPLFRRTQSYDELTEGINNADCPLLQVYWESYNMDPTGEVDRTTFRAGVRQKPITVHADVYASQRNHLAQNMASVIEAADAILDVLEDQDVKPYFGLEGIKAWQLTSATRALFPYASRGEQIEFTGLRLVFWFGVF